MQTFAGSRPSWIWGNGRKVLGTRKFFVLYIIWIFLCIDLLTYVKVSIEYWRKKWPYLTYIILSIENWKIKWPYFISKVLMSRQKCVNYQMFQVDFLYIIINNQNVKLAPIMFYFSCKYLLNLTLVFT